MDHALILAVTLIASLAAVAFYVSLPLRRRDWAREDEARMRVANLEWERNILLYGLKELEMDYRMKKMSDADYQSQREAMLADVSRLIASLEAERALMLNLEIERQVAARRGLRS